MIKIKKKNLISLITLKNVQLLKLIYLDFKNIIEI